MSAPQVHEGASLVIAADSVRARLFQARTPDAGLEEIEDLLNPESRMHEHDLVEDTAGRRGSRPTQAKRSAFGGEGAKDHRAEEFAARVCAQASAKLRESGAERLYVIADPEFLGLLRKRMDKQLARCVAGEVARSVAGKPADQIRDALPARL